MILKSSYQDLSNEGFQNFVLSPLEVGLVAQTWPFQISVWIDFDKNKARF